MSSSTFGLILATIAGLSTAIGGLLGMLFSRATGGHLAVLLGFSAGVMVYVSFVELLDEAITSIGIFGANLAFFSGIAFIGLLDLVIPHEYEQETSRSSNGLARTSLMRVGVLTALGIAIHNLPEGLVVFSSSIGGNQTLAIVVATAIGLHNIPEGISIYVPIYQGTGSKKRAFLYSVLAGVIEPVGALIGLAILLPILTPAISAGLLAFSGGIMVYISLDELLPAAHKYGGAHLVILGATLGMAVMAASLAIIHS